VPAPSTDTARASRGGRPRDPSRDAVIRAAILQLLADIGYDGLTMDAVASQAGVGKATIYRRWRTKQDLVVDTVAELNRAEITQPDTGSLRSDLRELLHSLVALINGPAGAAILSLLSTVPHHPALAEAFRDSPLDVWQHGFQQVWARAAQRGEVPPGLAGTVACEVSTSLLVQRWLLTRQPVDDAYANEVLDTVILPLVSPIR